MATKSELQSWWVDSAASGSLIPYKHSPTSLATPQDRFRTTLTPAASSSLQRELSAGAFSVSEVKFKNHVNTCYVASFTNPSMTPSAIGIPSGSTSAEGTTFDRFLFKSGSNHQWEVYGVIQSKVDEWISSGSVTMVDPDVT